MPCCGSGNSVEVGTRRKPFPREEGKETMIQVRYPNGNIRRFWDAAGADNAIITYGAVEIDSDGNVVTQRGLAPEGVEVEAEAETAAEEPEGTPMTEAEANDYAEAQAAEDAARRQREAQEALDAELAAAAAADAEADAMASPEIAVDVNAAGDDSSDARATSSDESAGDTDSTTS